MEHKFNPFLSNEYEDEDLLLERNRDRLAAIKSTKHDITRELELLQKEYEKKYRDTYLKWQFITRDILMRAPSNFFDQYESTIEAGVKKVQLDLSTQNLSGLISDVTADPGNTDKRTEAYKSVYPLVADYMNTTAYRGIDRDICISNILDEVLGYSKLEPLWQDSKITEIIINGPRDVQVEISGKLYRVKACKFRDKQHLMNLFEKLFGPLNKQVSRMTPRVKGRLYDFSRIYAVHDSVAPTGPNFNLRRHKDEYISPEQLVSWGAASEELMVFIGNLVNAGASFAVLGGTGSGKTTLLSALTGFIRPDARIVSVEDNLEMKPCPTKMLAAPMECVEARKDVPGDKGVTMLDLVQSTTQMKPHVILVGEVTDAAAYAMVQAGNTGHVVATTFHADDEHAGVLRLVSLISEGGTMSGINSAMPLVGQAFDIIIKVENFPLDGSRRITSVSEVSPIPVRNEHGELELEINQLWEFKVDKAKSDATHKVHGTWVQTGDMSDYRIHKLRLDTLTKIYDWEELCKMSDGVPIPEEEIPVYVD